MFQSELEYVHHAENPIKDIKSVADFLNVLYSKICGKKNWREHIDCCLKKIDSIKMRSDIELIKYDNTTTPAFLWQDHYILSFYFFVVMVGFTDACIDYEDKNISYNTKFVDVDSKYHKQEIHLFRKCAKH